MNSDIKLIMFLQIEYRPKTEGAEWAEGPEPVKPKKFLTGVVEELETGNKYEFRVTAVNRVGKSDPSEPTAPQLIKAQKAPPKVDRKVLKEEMTFKVFFPSPPQC